MSVWTERRWLQAAIALGCLVPLLAGGAGLVIGPSFLRGTGVPVAPDLDSHLRYLSGLLMGIGGAFATCVPAVETKGRRLRLLGCLVLIGGAGRLLSWAMIGAPGLEHRLGLGMELLVVPLLMLWQARIRRRWEREMGEGSLRPTRAPR